MASVHILVGATLTGSRIVQNAAMKSKVDKRMYIGHEIDECTDFEYVTYRLAFERVRVRKLGRLARSRSSVQGLLIDWDVEKAVWDGILSPQVLVSRFSRALTYEC